MATIEVVGATYTLADQGDPNGLTVIGNTPGTQSCSSAGGSLCTTVLADFDTVNHPVTIDLEHGITRREKHAGGQF